mgnify:CR=1 FL=1
MAKSYKYTLLQDGNSPWMPGQIVTVGAYFNIASTTGSAGFGDADTITATNLIPPNGVKILSVLVTGSEMDTNVAPTGTFKVGDATDPARFISAASQGTNVASGQLVQYQNVAPAFDAGVQTKGAGYEYATDQNTNAQYGYVDLVTTITAAPATAATSGVIYLYVTYACNGIA